MIVEDLLENRVLISALIAWAIAQLLKLIISFVVSKKFNIQMLISSGSFPSSHSAMVCALAVGVGKSSGWSSPLFAIAAVFAMIVMYDATGVRHAAGKQAKVLNLLIESLQPAQISRINQERLKELIGHTPFEVFGGALLGIVIGAIV